MTPSIPQIWRGVEAARPWLLAALIVVLAAFAYGPLLRGGLILTGDGAHAFRIYEMEQCLEDGQIPCRWAPDLGNGHGQPLFNYYSPLPYYVGTMLHDLGLSYLGSVSALYVIAVVGAGLSMFMLTRRLWGDLGGFVSAIAYVYAPYVALDLYLRGTLAELWALAIVPALLWSVYELVALGRRAFVLPIALFTALLLLSHHLVALIVAPLIVLWAGALLATTGRQAWQRAALGAAGAVWGFGLAAFFTLPVLLEGDLIRLDNVARTATMDTYLYESAFASVHDLFLLRSNDYSSLLRQQETIPLQLGWFHWLAVITALPLGVYFLTKRQATEGLAVFVFALAFGIGVFMAISASRFVWDSFDSLRFLQFPYRYLGLTSLATAALAGAWLAVLRHRPWSQQLAVAAVLTLVFAGTGATFFRPYVRCTEANSVELSCPPSDSEYFSPGYVSYLKRSGIEAYLPVDVGFVAEPPAEAAVLVIGDARIEETGKGSDWLDLRVDAVMTTTVQASMFEFPNWRVRVDGREVPHWPGPVSGQIRFDVPPGSHDVSLRLEDTDVRRLGNTLSLVSWVLLGLVGAGLIAAWFFQGWGSRIRD